MLKHLDMTRHAIKKINSTHPVDTIIWKSIHHEDFQRPIRIFFWKTMHNAHKIGDYWILKAKNKEEWAKCHRCGENDSIDHAIIECDSPEVKTIWPLAESLWRMKLNDWPEIKNIASILACGAVEFKSRNGNKLPGASRLYRIIISESAYLIWKLRCKRLFEATQDEPLMTEKEVHNRWIKTINMRLELDKTLTKSKYNEKAVKRKTVLQTWRGTIKDEKNLPIDWTRINGVVVGIGRKESHDGAHQEGGTETT